MEIDVDDILEYPEDDLFPQDNFGGDDFGENNDRNQRPNGRSSPAPKRRTLPVNEIANRIACLDQTTLDPSLDWYLRIDLSGAGGRIVEDERERERRVERAIQRIQSARISIADGRNANLDGIDSAVNPCKIYNYPPRHTNQWLPITSPIERSRYYVTLKPERWEQRWAINNQSISGNLLGEDFDKMLLKAEEMNEAKRVLRVEEPPPMFSIPDTSTLYFSEQMDSAEVIKKPGERSTKKTPQSVLWVDKYKPRGYIDLLSDDGVNRTLLTWLKLWDECVFGRKATKSATKRFTGPAVFKQRTFSKFGGGGFQGGKTGNAQAIDADSLPTNLDQYKRPVQKIVLLSGPPGVGKTTLAHVVARHAGYYVQEMNASDDRTLDAFRKQLEGATQMQATLDGARRPHCLVIDEVDGAPAPSVNYLVSLASNASSEDGGDQSNKPAANKNKKGTFVLRRPIICICNDIYAPALRELRKVALVLHVPPIDSSRLTERLNQISHRESVRPEPGCFELMCTKSGFDVRSCINSLQLLTFDDGPKAGKSEKRLTLQQVSKADVGGKDMQRSLFATWQAIFQIPKVQKRTAQNETSMSSMATRVRDVLIACYQCGESDRLQAGIFENYLSVDFRDPRLEAVCHGMEWFQFVDLIDRVVGESQSYELKRYSCYVSAVFHLHFANRQYTKLVYPQMVQESYFKIQKASAILQSLMVDVKCNIRAFLSSNTLVTDILPLLLEIVQPSLRPVNVQLYTEQEKRQMQRIVDVMRDYNLTYRQQRSSQGQYEFVLEPPVADIVSISTTISTGYKDQMDKRPTPPAHAKSKLSDTVKQAIAREIEIAKVRVKESKSGSANQGASKVASDKSKPSLSKPNENFLKSTLFGARRNAENDAESEALGEKRVWFKYHEGCNNAIRRFLRISDLM